MRSLLENVIIIEAARRVASMEGKKLTKSDFQRLMVEDVKKAIARSQKSYKIQRGKTMRNFEFAV